MDPSDRVPRGLQSPRGIATYAICGRGAIGGRSGENEAVKRFETASEAVSEAAAFVAHEPPRRYAAVITGEYSADDMDSVRARLLAVSAFAECGQVVVALATQEIARQSLGAEFGFRLLGSAHTSGRDVRTQLVERLFFVEHASLPVTTGRARTPVACEAAPFFGRRRELEELAHLIDFSRLVTVLGITGVGKTSLLRRFTADHGDRFPDGAVKIDLSLIDQSKLVVPTVASVLDAPKLPGEDYLEAVVAYLARRRFMLVLDNAEHVLDETVRLVTAVVAGCPEVAVVVGSQRPLRLPFEARFRLGGLRVPHGETDWRSIQEFEAVTLFVDRAQLLDPKYRVADEDAPSISDICRNLEGNPLAIELAAFKTLAFGPRQIQTRLPDRLALFSDPTTNRPERHRSLNAAIEWAYRHLSSQAKVLLRRLSVFSGAFSADHAMEVCADPKMPEMAAIDAFEELLDCSMLAPTEPTGQEKRFRLSETVRLFARRTLRESDEVGPFEARHRKWCAHLCDQARAGLASSEQLLWLERLDAHMDDIRALVERSCLPRGDGLLAVRTLLSIHQYYFLRHFLSDGYQMAILVVKAKSCRGAPELFRVQNLVSVLAGRVGDSEAAREYALRSICSARRRAERSGVARARQSLGFYYEDQGNFPSAFRHFRWTVREFRRLGQDVFLMKSLINVSVVETWLGYLADSEAHLNEAGLLLDRYPDATLRAYWHQNSGHLSLAEGRFRDALGHSRTALRTFCEAQELYAACTSLRNVSYALEGMAVHALAAQFAGANRKLMHQLDQRHRAYETEAFEQMAKRLKDALGQEAFDRNVFLGAESTLEELIEQAGSISGS